MGDQIKRGLLDPIGIAAAGPLTRLSQIIRDITRIEIATFHESICLATDPPPPAELRAKFHDMSDPLIGSERANRINDAIDTLNHAPLGTLTRELFQPLSC